MTEVKRHTPIKGGFSYADLAQRFRDRQEQVGGLDYKNVFEFTFLAQPLINLMSDLHIGHPTTDYRRIEDEVNEISATANSFVVFMGDEIDNMHWNPGQMEQMEQTPEQILFFWAIIRHLSDQDKLLMRIPGDHDGWLKRQGFDINAFVRERGVNTASGGSHMIANVSQQRYVGYLHHRLPGFSMYNRNHPQMRAERFGAGRGSDFIASGHNHQKQIAEGFTYDDLGETRPISYISLGSYKPTDGWLQSKGYPPQNKRPEEMYGAAVMLNAEEHEIFVSADIVEANRAYQKMYRRAGRVNRLTPLSIKGFVDEDVTELWKDWDSFGDEGPTENG